MSAGSIKPRVSQTHNEYHGPHRNGEHGPIPPRSRRFYFNGEHWFFRTRERITFGPYNTFREAEEYLKLYLRRCGVVRYRMESPTPP